MQKFENLEECWRSPLHVDDAPDLHSSTVPLDANEEIP